MKRILVVDDDIMIRKVLKIILEDRYEVEIAENGIVALEGLEKFHPDMVITDLEMTAMSGIELAEEIECFDILNKSNIKIILMSGNYNELCRIEESALYKNIDAFVSKPFNVINFLAKIEVLLR
ncbi:MAG: response regulator [Patescibacteria group bacterium]